MFLNKNVLLNFFFKPLSGQSLSNDSLTSLHKQIKSQTEKQLEEKKKEEYN